MAISEKVNQIIVKRKERVPLIENKIATLKAIVNAVEQFDRLKDSIVDRNGGLIPDSPYVSIVNDNPGMLLKINAISTETFKAKAKELLENYNYLKTRFSREGINIAVVGGARQGKSQTLQSISGLDDYVIPALLAGDCTGATSIVKNDTQAQLTAKIKFRTEHEMLNIVQDYLDVVLGNDSIKLTSISQIPKLDMKEIRGKLEIGSPHAEELKHLEKYVLRFDEWRGLIELGEKTIYDKEEIATYVAQHNGKPDDDPSRINYYKYMAVNAVEISCRFPIPDAGQIVLIDTIGIGDTKLGIDDAMIRAVDKESDAAIILKRPESGSGGLVKSDINTYKMLFDNFKEKRMEKWLFWMINEVVNHPSYGTNSDRCKAVYQQIKANNWALSDCKIINVKDAKMVQNDFLIPMLTKITENLDDIDASFLDEANKLGIKLFDEFDKLYRSIEKVLNTSIQNSANGYIFIREAFEKIYKNKLLGALIRYDWEWSVKRSEPCEILQEQARDILENINSFVPSEEEIRMMFEENGGIAPTAVWEMELDKVRTNLTEAFIAIDTSLEDLVTNFKNDITKILLEDEKGRLKYVKKPNEEKPLYHWLKDFSEEILSNGNYSQINLAFEFLHNFTVSVRGFLMHKVRAQLDIIRPLNPEASGVMLTADRNGNYAGDIHFYLTVKMEQVRENLDSVLKNFFKDPNEAFFAVIDEFFDRLAKSQDVEKQWYSLYSNYAGRIWAKELAQQAGIGVAFDDWTSKVEKLAEYDSEDNFIVRLR